MATIKVEYLGFEGQGKTVAQAKADAARRAESFIAAAKRAPIYASVSGDGVVVFPLDSGNWGYKVLWRDQDEPGTSLYTSSGFIDEADALSSALYHICQARWDSTAPKHDDEAHAEKYVRTDVYAKPNWRHVLKSKLLSYFQDARHAQAD